MRVRANKCRENDFYLEKTYTIYKMLKKSELSIKELEKKNKELSDENKKQKEEIAKLKKQITKQEHTIKCYKYGAF